MKSMQVRKVSYSDQQAKLDAFRVSQNIHFKLYLNLRFPDTGWPTADLGNQNVFLRGADRS